MFKNAISRWSVWAYWAMLCYASLVFWPKWNMSGSEATLSWDVSGYYLYLPATFIYKDLRDLKFYDSVLTKYQPTPGKYQAEKYPETGHYIMSYPCGQAVIYAPFFGVGHAVAKMSGGKYAADGFSRPYQVAISVGMLLVALLGLLLLRSLLLYYFNDVISAVVLGAIVLGTNYLDYASITGAMSHNALFTIYAAVMLLSRSFHKSPTYTKAAGIGLLIGLAALTRPTEILMCLIPLLWPLAERNTLSELIQQKFAFFKINWRKLSLAIGCCLAVGSLQLMYWKYVTGHWIVYHYSGQGFDFLHPHLMEGLLGFNCGWLIYSPMMWFGVMGLFLFRRRLPSYFWMLTIYVLLFVYVTLSWKIWWYGGSLGHRAMVQSYPMWALALGVFFERIAAANIGWRVLVGVLFSVFTYQNLWLTYQAHKGGLFHAEQMTKAYFMHVWGTYDKKTEDIKLLDTEEIFEGTRQDVKTVYHTDFETDTTQFDIGLPAIQGNRSMAVDGSHEFSAKHKFLIKQGEAQWLRVAATFRSVSKEWNFWAMPHFKVILFDGEKTVQQRSFRPFRFMGDNETKELYLDVPLPKNKKLDSVAIELWNAGSQKPMQVDNLKAETFR